MLRGACNRITTWVQCLSSPRCFGYPIMAHFGNALNSWTTFFRLSMVQKQCTQNMILTWISKGSTYPNGRFSGSTNPRQFILNARTIRHLASLLHVPLLILSYPPIPASCQDLGVDDQRCTHGGHPLEFPLVVLDPHVISLHQSRSFNSSVKPRAH